MLRRLLTTVLPSTLALAGWAYWGTTVLFFWNFVSWLLLVGGLGLFLPAPLLSFLRSKAPGRGDLLLRRMVLAGIMLGALMIALYSNLSIFPQQLHRRLSLPASTIQPNNALVQNFTALFWSENPPASFNALPFAQRMLIVDKFVYKYIRWEESYSLYKVVGLIASPTDVLSRMAGDCQGQSAVTASLLMAMGGYQAYCVETPFHWWTHAVEVSTGLTYDLNTHGNGGPDGTVLPQPIDMVYTWYPPACTNCSYVMSHNRDTTYYLAPPPRALMIALTGAHIFQRDVLPNFEGKNFVKTLVFGAAFGLVVGIYATLVQLDFGAFTTQAGRKRVAVRACVGVVGGVLAFVMMVAFAILYYPVTLMHMCGVLAFTMNYACSDGFNAAIGTPAPPTRGAAPEDRDDEYAPAQALDAARFQHSGVYAAVPASNFY
jgi:MFS family permease